MTPLVIFAKIFCKICVTCVKGKFNNFWTCPLSNQKLFIISVLCNFQHLMELFTNPMFVELCVWMEMGMGMGIRMGVGVKDVPFPQV